MGDKRNITRKEFIKKSGKTAAAVAIGSALPGIFSSCSEGISDRDYDIIIRGGTVYDGTDSDPRIADIGIRNDTIAFIGTIEGSAGQTINATGSIVTPGFIDVHTHCDLTFKRTGWQRHLARFMPSWKGNYCYAYQGVSTVITGNCGYGYTDANYWFDLAESIDFGSNVCHLVPHGSIRHELFGGNQARELSTSQLNIFKNRIFEEFEKGAVGFSTGLEYAPGIHSNTHEIIELCKVAARFNGVYTTHMRDESGRIYDDGSKGVMRSLNETIEIAQRAEVSTEISHLKIAEPINNLNPQQMLHLIERARSRGLNIGADQYPYAAGSTNINVVLPNEMKTSKSVREYYKGDAGKEKIRKAVQRVFEYLPPEKFLITYYPEKEEYEGKNLKEIAELEGKDPAYSYAEMVCEDTSPMAVFFSQNMEVVKSLMASDFIITASDGWTVPKDMSQPHPRCYGTFPRKIKRFAIEQNIVSLKRAIQSMTSLPAEKFNIQKRGKISVGNFADIAVIDLENLRDRATYENPHQYSEGIKYLLVNGTIAIQNGEATGDRGGKVIRRS